MDKMELTERLNKLSIWKKNGARAPHKPLLLLLALAELHRNRTVLPYVEVKQKLGRLLQEFGPPRKSYHPEHPFVRLRTDGIWRHNMPIEMQSYTDRNLLERQVEGGFTDEVLGALKGRKEWIRELAKQLLQDHFPESMHSDLLAEVGLDLEGTGQRRRNPEFRHIVLRAYEYSCAVCGFHVRLGHQLVGIEAAHIRWHLAGGPDTEDNGIALCALHHQLFDRGVFTIGPEREVLVAEEAHGSRQGFEELLMRYHGRQLRAPIRPVYAPGEAYVEWHKREVFRGPARHRIGC